jgi:chitin synthase
MLRATAISSPLPQLETALARSPGAYAPDISAPESPLDAPYQFDQPAPSYLPPVDPNHPDLSVGLSQATTVRFARSFQSRSPSPGMDESFDGRFSGGGDVEEALLRYQGTDTYVAPYDISQWDEKLSSLRVTDHGDLSLPPFRSHTAMAGDPYYIRASQQHGGEVLSATAGWTGLNEDDMADTKHFGPAPSGRVSRRTHNAAGHRRIKQTATLDENGFFAVDMPIPTRLAQFLPVKGVEEQRTTRCAH